MVWGVLYLVTEHALRAAPKSQGESFWSPFDCLIPPKDKHLAGINGRTAIWEAVQATSCRCLLEAEPLLAANYRAPAAAAAHVTTFFHILP